MSEFLPFVVIGLTSGSVYALAGVGLVLTYKTSGVFNFAHGTLAAVVAFAFYDLREKQGLPWPVAGLLCVLVLAPLLGLALERMGRRLADAPVAMKIVATVGLVVALQQIIIIRYGAGSIRMESFLPTDTFRLFDVNIGYDQLIVMATALVATLALTVMFSCTRLGRGMRGVVDNASLLAMTGTSPSAVRKYAWCIGSGFAGVSGVLLAPTIGLDSTVLTLLVVQAFGAAALGLFTSIPLTYAGGLVIGTLSALSTKYVVNHPNLDGLPPSLPFIALFIVLVAAPGRWLVDFTVERKPPVVEPRSMPRVLRVLGPVGIAVLVIATPDLVGVRLDVYTAGLAFLLILLSLALLMRTSGQVSLAQLAFAGVGGAVFARLSVETGLPWLLAVLVAALVAVPIGAVLAVPAIRRAGLYLALSTFAFALLLERLLFKTDLLFGNTKSSLPVPRPGWADSDRAYFYLLAVFAAAAAALVIAVSRCRLGRLLRAMADSPTALTTYGTNLVVIKVAVFCLSAFLAGLGGAVLGPVTESASRLNFTALAGLQLIVVLVLVPGGEIVSAIGAAVILTVVPAYITDPQMNDYLLLVYGFSAVLVAMTHAGIRVPLWLVRAAGRTRVRGDRSPLLVRLDRRQPEVVG